MVFSYKKAPISLHSLGNIDKDDIFVVLFFITLTIYLPKKAEKMNAEKQEIMKKSNNGKLCNVCGTFFDEEGFCSNGHEKDHEPEKELKQVEQLTEKCLVCNRPILPTENFCSHCD